MAVAGIEMLKIPGDLVLEFFATFSRFEYALKRAGYLKSDRTDRTYAAPNWDRFAVELNALGEAALVSIFQCCPYLQSHPPHVQVVRDGQLTWEKLPPADSSVAAILLSVKTVRNNLFHGGKFPDGEVTEPARDEHLIRDCLAVLIALQELPDLPDGLACHLHPNV